MSNIICPQHNAHFRILDDQNIVFLWIGKLGNDESFIRCKISPQALGEIGLQFKQKSFVHVTGLPDEITSAETILRALESWDKTLTRIDQDICLELKKA